MPSDASSSRRRTVRPAGVPGAVLGARPEGDQSSAQGDAGVGADRRRRRCDCHPADGAEAAGSASAYSVAACTAPSLAGRLLSFDGGGWQPQLFETRRVLVHSFLTIFWVFAMGLRWVYARSHYVHKAFPACSRMII